MAAQQEGSGPPDFANLRPIESRVIETIDTAMPATVAVRMGRMRGSSATGVLIGEDLVLTAGHVGERPGRVAYIELADGRTFKGRALGQVFQDGVDVGLIRIDTEGEELPKMAFGAIDDVAQGDWVVVLGHASLTPDNTDEAALPAARVGRVLRISGPRLDVDAPFDSGDSGGPVVDLDGRLLGIVSRCGHYAWQNVATNIRAIKDVLPELEHDDPEIPPSMVTSARRPPRTVQFSKRNPEFLEKLQHLTWSVSPAIVEVFQDDRLVCYGTVVGDERILTKASQLIQEADNPVVENGGTRFNDVDILAIDPRLDLALMEVPGLKAPALDWEVLEPEAGRFLVVPTPDGTARSMGTVSRDSDHLERSQVDRPFIGIGFDIKPDKEGISITRVVPSSSASRAGIEVADQLRTIDGEPINDRLALRNALEDREIGDQLLLGIERGEKDLEIPLRLGMRRGILDPINSNTSTGTSRHSSGYGDVILSDAVIAPHEVGVPLIDLNGNAIGLAIARRGRTVTVVLPSSRVQSIIKTLTARAEEQADELPEFLEIYRSTCSESDIGTLMLDAGDAIPRGDTIRQERFDDGRTTYGEWSEEDDALEWHVEIDRPGRFKAVLTYACSSRSAGTPIRLSIGEEFLDGNIESTDGWNDFEDQNLGVFEVRTPGRYTVRLEPLASPRRELMNFARLELIRMVDMQD